MKLLRYILFVIAVVSLQSGLAQRSDYQPEFTVGVKGGTTLSRVSVRAVGLVAVVLGGVVYFWVTPAGYRFVISKKNFSG